MLDHRQTYLSLPCLVRHGEEPEALPKVGFFSSDLPDEYYAVDARNALRNLTYGKPLFKGKLFSWSTLKLLLFNLKTLAWKRDPKLLAAMRTEVKQMLQEAHRVANQSSPAVQKQLEFFIPTLLSNFPFMDPEDSEPVMVPQKITDPNGQSEWRMIPSHFRRLDISPQTNWWARFLKAEDRLYAYGLEPQDPQASPYLLLMGTTYWSGQGSGLSLLGDVTPGLSVGERHNLSNLDAWIRAHQNIIVTGHSQGGTQGNLIAALYTQVSKAFLLNPAALHRDTLKRLLPSWHERRGQRAEINIVTQKNDPVFIFGDGLLPDTNIYFAELPPEANYSQVGSHARHFSGHKTVQYTQIPYDPQRFNTNYRQFMNDIKHVADYLLGPLLLGSLVFSAWKRDFPRPFKWPLNLIQAALSFALFTAAFTLIALSSLPAGVGYLKRAALRQQPSPPPSGSPNLSTQLSLSEFGPKPGGEVKEHNIDLLAPNSNNNPNARLGSLSAISNFGRSMPSPPAPLPLQKTQQERADSPAP